MVADLLSYGWCAVFCAIMTNNEVRELTADSFVIVVVSMLQCGFAVTRVMYPSLPTGLVPR